MLAENANGDAPNLGPCYYCMARPAGRVDGLQMRRVAAKILNK